jgi:hypothetical protein
LDEHFAGYTRIVAITYTGADGVEQFLPIIGPTGQPGSYLFGVIWLKWNYDFVTRNIDQPHLQDGIRNFTAFWAGKHNISLDNCRFQVKVKKIKEAHDWQPDFWRQQIAAGWIDAGAVTWKNKEFTANLADLKAL